MYSSIRQYHRGQWAADRGEVSPRIHPMISSEKIMFSVYFTRQGLVSIETLPKREQFNSAFFTLIIFSSIVGSVSVLRLKMWTQDYCPHIDDAKLHNVALSLQKTEEARFTKLLQQLYFPDLIPCDFFLFGYLKKELEGKNFKFENEINSA
jgi:hypothetical protein